jgi:hypothetical protein
MTKDEALDLALEALENSVDLVREDAYNAEKLYGNYPSRQGKVRGLKVLADDHEKAITAIKQARALDKMAENARELGLDYEPAGGAQVSKVWWDGEKLMAKPIPLEDIYQPAPVQEPVACDGDFPEGFDASFGIPAQALRQANAALCEVTNNRMWDVPALAERMMRFRHHTTPPAAQRQWVSLTNEEKATAIFGADKKCLDYKGYADAIEAKLKELNT